MHFSNYTDVMMYVCSVHNITIPFQSRETVFYYELLIYFYPECTDTHLDQCDVSCYITMFLLMWYIITANIIHV